MVLDDCQGHGQYRLQCRSEYAIVWLKTIMINSLDDQLIQLLQTDASQSSEVLARQLHVSPATVRRRKKQLTRSGALRTVALVDPEKMGFPLVAAVALDVARDQLESAVQILSRRPEITWLSTTTGRFDILSLARFRSTSELANFVQRELAAIQGLRATETFICLEVSKGRYIQV